ncbi:MAG: copper resistance protein CopC [Micrococcaceae bacterium]
MRTVLRLLISFFAIFTLFAPSASAHDELTGSIPADNAIVQTSPSEIQLNFNDSVMTMGAEFSVTAVQGDKSNVIEGEPQYQGTRVTQKLKANLPEGTYNAAWRVVSADGHPIGGVVKFSVGHQSQESQTSQQENQDNSSMTWLWPTLAVVVACIALVAFWFNRKQKAHHDV